jgi:hypothetical protein
MVQYVLIQLLEHALLDQHQTEPNVFRLKPSNAKMELIFKMECVLVNQIQFVIKELGMDKLVFQVVKAVVHKVTTGITVFVLLYQDQFVNLDL